MSEEQKDDNASQIATLSQQLKDTAEELERYKLKHAEAEKHRKQAEKDARRAGDNGAIEKTWSEKYTNRETELLAEIAQRDNWLKQITVGRAAESIAADLAIQGSAAVLARLIQDRLTSEIRDGKPVTVVLDTEGRPSSKTLDDLRNEFFVNPAFAPLIAGSKASGSGGINGKGGTPKGPRRRDMSTRQKAEYIDRHGVSAYNNLA